MPTTRLKAWIEAKESGHDIPLNLEDAHQTLEGLVLIDAINAHKAWIDKLDHALSNKNPDSYDATVVSADHLCALGKWLREGGGVQYATLPEGKTLLVDHAEFHKCAGEVITNHKNGDLGEAIRLLRYVLVKLSNKVQIDLVKLLIAVHS